MAKEGAIVKCVSCQEELRGDEYWAITQFKKVIDPIPCPSCGKPFTVEYNPASDSYIIDKKCPCILGFNSRLFERQAPKWKKKSYPLCKDCAKKIFGSTVIYAELGEDQNG